MKNSVYALIPARGGSKGIPGKNIKMLLGKPLIEYTIDAAKESGIFSEIIVSTESKEIASIAEAAGAYVPFLRPKHLAEDHSLAVDTYIYTILELEKMTSSSIEHLTVLQPTSPLRNAEDIQNAYKLFIEREADSVASYTKEHHPVFWHKFIRQNLSFENLFQENVLKNRQEVKPTYYPNGSIFIFKKELIMQKQYYSDKSYAYIMPRIRSVDIDDMDDFRYAEFLLQNKLAAQ